MFTNTELALAIIIPELFSMIVDSSEINQNRKSALRFLLMIFFSVTTWIK